MNGILCNDWGKLVQVGWQVSSTDWTQVREPDAGAPEDSWDEDEVYDLVAVLLMVVPIEGKLSTTNTASEDTVQTIPTGMQHYSWMRANWRAAVSSSTSLLLRWKV